MKNQKKNINIYFGYKHKKKSIYLQFSTVTKNVVCKI